MQANRLQTASFVAITLIASFFITGNSFISEVSPAFCFREILCGFLLSTEIDGKTLQRLCPVVRFTEIGVLHGDTVAIEHPGYAWSVSSASTGL